MNFTIETSVPLLTVFMQGLFSFFSPCVLPLVPLYMSYFAGTANIGNGSESKGRRIRILTNTVFFVLGISLTFFLLGFGFTALGQFFNNQQIWLSRFGGLVMILLGLYQSGLLGNISPLEKEHRFHPAISRIAMGPLPALVLGFTFSFSWTPCVGPALTSVLLLASSSSQGGIAAFLIAVYTAGFTIPFLLVALFSERALAFFQRYKNIVKYTVKAGAILLIVMGIMMLTGFMNGVTNYLSAAAGPDSAGSEAGISRQEGASTTEEKTDKEEDGQKAAEDNSAPDICLTDQYGNSHQLSSYKGKTVFINFWATWCGPCRSEMDEIQELYESLGRNQKEVVILSIAAPQWGREGSETEIISFLEEKGYTYPVLMDHGGLWFSTYGIRAYPTTFLIQPSGQVFGYIEGAMTKSIMESAIRQASESEK